MDLMSAKKRSLEEEKSELKKAMEHLHIRVSQLQKKWVPFKKYKIESINFNVEFEIVLMLYIVYSL